jgi:hypothetical protein
MGTITDIASLKKQIALLEQKRDDEKHAITAEFHNLLESLKPVNLLKSLFRSVKESSDLKSDLLHGAIGMATGFVTNKLLLGKINGPFKALFGTLLQAGITKAAVSYPETIKTKGLSFLINILNSLKIRPGHEVDQEHANASAVL